MSLEGAQISFLDEITVDGFCGGIVCPHRAPKKDSPEKPEPEKGGDAS